MVCGLLPRTGETWGVRAEEVLTFQGRLVRCGDTKTCFPVSGLTVRELMSLSSITSRLLVP